MVYCSKCGHKNPDDAEKCQSCGEMLAARPTRRRPKRKEDECFGPGREIEEECFGLPRGGAVFTIVVGIIIVFVGALFILNDIFDWDVDIWGNLWAIFIIAIGLLILIGAIYRSREEG